MYRRILAPIDASPASKRALDQALGLAAAQRARLRVVNVVDERFLGSAIGAFPVDAEQLVASIRSAGRHALSEAQALAGAAGVDVETEIIESAGRTVSEIIIDDAHNWGADLIVMGTHGRRGLNRLLMGSDAERVLHATPVPLLLVRQSDAAAGEGEAPTHRR